MKIDKLDLAILQTIALGRLPEFASRLVDEVKIPKRTVQNRVKRLQEEGLCDENRQLTETGKDTVAKVRTLREKRHLVISHAFWFNCPILHKPEGLAFKGWKQMQFREWQNQYLLRNREFLLRVVGNTLVIHVGPVAGVGPVENSFEAFKRALSLVRVLEDGGWRLGELVEQKPSEHVLAPLKPLAEAVYAARGGVDLLDALVDNSRRDGGEFEAGGVEAAHQLFADIARLPRFRAHTEARLTSIEDVLRKMGLMPPCP